MSEGKSSCLGASFNLINQIVGAGIVGLPYAISQCGFFTGVFMLTFVAYLVDSSVLMLIRSGIKADKFHLEEVAEHYLGKPGYYSTLLFMFILGIGNQVAYLVIIGDTIPIVLQLFLGDIFITNRNVVICGLAAFVILPLSLLKDLSSLEWTSLLSVIGVTVLIIIVVVASPYEGRREKIQPEVDIVSSSLFAGIGTIAFAIVCQHNSFLVFQSLEDQTYENWRKVAHLSIGFSYILCLMIGLSGYLSFADLTHGDLLTNFPGDDPAVNVARFLLGITSIFAYPMDNYVSRHCIITIIHRVRSETKSNNLSSLFSSSWFNQYVKPLFSTSSSSTSLSMTPSAKAQYKPIVMNDEINSPRLLLSARPSIEMMNMNSSSNNINNDSNSNNNHNSINTASNHDDTVFDSLSSSVRRRSSFTTSSPSQNDYNDGVNNTRPVFNQQTSESSLIPHNNLTTINPINSSGNNNINNHHDGHSRAISHSHSSVSGGGNIYTNTIGESLETDYENELSYAEYVVLSIFLWGLSLALAIVFTNLGIVLSLTGAVAASIIGFSLPGLIYLKAFESEFYQAVYICCGVTLKRNSTVTRSTKNKRRDKTRKNKNKIDKYSTGNSNSNGYSITDDDDDDDDDIWSVSNDYESDINDTTNNGVDDDADDSNFVASEYGLRLKPLQTDFERGNNDDNNSQNKKNKIISTQQQSSSLCYRIFLFGFYAPVFMVFFGFIALITGVGTVIMQGG